MTRKRLVLHVGLQKTGTSSVQVMLASSKAGLERAGYYYPELPNPRNDVWTSPARHNILAGTYADYHSAFDKLTSAEDSQFWREVHSSDLSPILSAEDFSRQKSFAELAGRVGGLSVLPVVYLRRQDRFVESLYNQRNKILLMRGSPELLDPGLLSEASLFKFIAQQNYRQVLNYERLTSCLEAHLPAERMIVRVFDRDKLTNGDVCQDFAVALQLNASDLAMPGSYANESVSNVVLGEIISILVEHGEKAALERMQAVREALRRGESFGGSYSILTGRTRSDLLKQYADINQQVEQRYKIELG